MSEVQQRVYQIVLSCEKDLIINNKPIEKLINDNLKGEGMENLDIEHTKRQKDVILAMHDLRYLNHVKKNNVYVIDTHSDFNDIAYFQLGYAMGAEMEIIGYYDGQHGKKIHGDVSELTRPQHSANRKDFYEMIKKHIFNTMGVQLSTPKEWDNTYGVTEEESEAHDGI